MNDEAAPTEFRGYTLRIEIGPICIPVSGYQEIGNVASSNQWSTAPVRRSAPASAAPATWSRTTDVHGER
jgi:hypothetical protein